ncbi:NAD(P)H-binding protein [Pseudonocardia pini]|uniref:NAD(P)H-binding protein n=1 Tax=Pseudonocardia pini TaxID=2758030 RepID=UPI0015F020DC|nr:NAD(P)H-binding protein [Pseudonocardia pini]
MITVLGATGNTGRRAAVRLVEAGEQVRAVSRSGRPVPGTETWQGDAGDREFLTRAFTGADAAYVLLPFELFEAGYVAHQDRLGTAVTEALRAARVPYVVALSAVGAEVPGGTGYLASLHAQEQRLRTLDADVLFLRPGLFFESFLYGLDAMRAEGVHADTIDPAVRLPMVATGDVGDAAAEALLGRTRTGVRELLGPADLTVPEAIAQLGPRVGLPDLGYVRVPDEAMVDALTGIGMPPDVAALHVEMNAAFNSGLVHSAGRTADATTPTTVAIWADALGVPA